MAGHTKTAKERGTIRTHVIHYLMFASSLGLGDDLLLDKPDSSFRRGQLTFALYAEHLSTGNSVYCKRIRAATVQKYLLDVSRFMRQFGPTERDYCMKTPGGTEWSAELKAVYDANKKFEDQGNRREAFTLDMLRELETSNSACGALPDDKSSALADWFQVGLYMGLRLSEWAQPTSSDPSSPDLNIRGDTQAFCLDDIRVQLTDGRRLQGADILSVCVTRIRKMWIRLRTQKNGRNGEQKLFTASPKGGRDVVVPMYRILERFVRLRGKDDLTTPLAIYSLGTIASTGAPLVRTITSTDIEFQMRLLAAKVYHLHPVRNSEDLSKWSSHSLRVGACVILHSMGFSETQLKQILRWNSDSFMLYLRDIAVVADEHVKAFDAASCIPNFL